MPTASARTPPAVRRGQSRATRVAVLGAGIQGACAALELARRGCEVDLYDREQLPVSQASLWNEGKIHLGYVYANDAPARTARTLTLGSLHFAAALERWGIDGLEDDLSEPFAYVVHRRSMLGVDRVRHHLEAVAAQGRELSDALGLGYLGSGRGFGVDLMPDREVGRRYDERQVLAAFRTGERSVDPERLAVRLRAALAAEDRVHFHGGRWVHGAERDRRSALSVVSGNGNGQGPSSAGYKHVVNALWGDRLRVDAMLDLVPDRPWLYRYKLALHVRLPEPLGEPPPSTTLLLGPFGDIVNFGTGRLYLSWYPACRIGATEELAPHDWGAGVSDEVRRQVFDTTLARLAEVVPEVARLPIGVEDADVEGGVIFNWGATDITDPRGEVHQRWDIGVHSDRGYHSIDTGKYCMGPYFALQVADRIRPREK